MMAQVKRNILITASIFCLSISANTTPVFAANNFEVGLLKSNQSFRSNFSSQPNLDKGEVSMPVQVSIIYIVKQKLPDFLLQLASRNSVELTLSEKVTGDLAKISLPMQLELILPELSKSYGLEWHMQGKHLFVSNSLENANRIITLEDMNFLQLKTAIENADLNSGTNKMSFAEEKNSVTLIGFNAIHLKDRNNRERTPKYGKK